MIRDGYLARWRGREYEASPDGDQVRLYRPDAAEGFEQVRADRLPVAWRAVHHPRRARQLAAGGVHRWVGPGGERARAGGVRLRGVPELGAPRRVHREPGVPGLELGPAQYLVGDQVRHLLVREVADAVEQPPFVVGDHVTTRTQCRPRKRR